LIKQEVKASLPTHWGDFDIYAFTDTEDSSFSHLALVHKQIDLSIPVPVRIHSECLTGDLFGSARCDCGEQLEASMDIISREKGVLIYLRQEGRGIGLVNKLKAYNLQDTGMDTVDANVHLGFDPDQRDYGIAVEMLMSLGVQKIRLITNNPDKINVIDKSPIELAERIPLIIEPGDHNQAYLVSKKKRMGHLY
jgi:3,4-dihydroxy 2-butanone 4-phosphate synthase/GTP cyclohydrolase II